MTQRQPYGRLTATDWILIGVLACVIVGSLAVARQTDLYNANHRKKIEGRP
jgi:hypothetical protein